MHDSMWRESKQKWQLERSIYCVYMSMMYMSMSPLALRARKHPIPDLLRVESNILQKLPYAYQCVTEWHSLAKQTGKCAKTPFQRKLNSATTTWRNHLFCRIQLLRLRMLHWFSALSLARNRRYKVYSVQVNNGLFDDPFSISSTKIG